MTLLLMFQFVMCLMFGAIGMLALIAFGTLLVLELRLISKRNKRLKRRVK